ncbi:hypothetical protein D3Z38_19285 [Clostridiales bacterium]|uniref:Ribbon-helix-helix protein, CopG family n=1 Tax=Muribaculaceae bacterium Z82 TaxID=2304548 RepID=A0A7C9NN41_9BACT|nr:hypothetical protein [Clostridiales bacterium]
MNDEELCRMFGLTLDWVEAEAGKAERGDYSSFDFSKVMDGMPLDREKMEMVSAPVGESRIAAMRRVTDKEGISRAEFIRRAIDHELLATA